MIYDESEWYTKTENDIQRQRDREWYIKTENEA